MIENCLVCGNEIHRGMSKDKKKMQSHAITCGNKICMKRYKFIVSRNYSDLKMKMLKLEKENKELKDKYNSIVNLAREQHKFIESVRENLLLL